MKGKCQIDFLSLLGKRGKIIHKPVWDEDIAEDAVGMFEIKRETKKYIYIVL